MTTSDDKLSRRSNDRQSAGMAGAQVEAAGWIIRTLGDKGFGGALAGFGIAIAGASMGLRFDSPGRWGFRELATMLGFAALLVVLGCLDRLLVRPEPPTPSSSTTPAVDVEKAIN